MADSSAHSQPFDPTIVPKISAEQAQQEALRARNEAALGELGGPSAAKANGAAGPAAAPSAAEAASLYAQQLAEVPELASYGPVLQSTRKPVELTESETEYVVTVVKHVFAEHIVFQVRQASRWTR